MLEARIYHKEIDYPYTAQLDTDEYGANFDTIHDNTLSCNYLTFDGRGINLVDENLKFYEENEYTGYTLPYISNANCEITEDDSVASLFINTVNVQDFYPSRLTLQFKDDCCREIEIIYFNQLGLKTMTQKIDVLGKFLTVTFERNYYKIHIHFKKTVYPHQYIRLESVVFGTINTFNEFKNHNLIEEINVLSDDLPINQFEASIVNDKPEDVVFAKKDPLVLFSNGKYYGHFYITDVQRSAKNIFDLKSQNSLSLYESNFTSWQTNAYGEIYVSEIISNLEKSTETDIDISQEINNEIISGYHKDGTRRAALCELGYCLGRIVDGSRSDKITLKPIPTKITSIITNSERRIIGNALFKRKDPYSVAIINYQKRYPLDVVEDELSSKPINGKIGDIVTIYFDKPTLIITNGFSLVSSGFEIISQTMTTYIVKLTSTNGTIVYVDAPMSDTKQVAVTNENAEFENVKNFNNFLTRPNSDTIFTLRNENIKKYIQSRGTVTAKIRLRGEKAGDLIQIETAWDGIITGIITKMDITFGYEDIADIEVLEWNL